MGVAAEFFDGITRPPRVGQPPQLKPAGGQNAEAFRNGAQAHPRELVIGRNERLWFWEPGFHQPPGAMFEALDYFGFARTIEFQIVVIASVLNDVIIRV